MTLFPNRRWRDGGESSGRDSTQGRYGFRAVRASMKTQARCARKVAYAPVGVAIARGAGPFDQDLVNASYRVHQPVNITGHKPKGLDAKPERETLLPRECGDHRHQYVVRCAQLWTPKALFNVRNSSAEDD
ncbi:hypothetical protein [Xylella fastidiosa]|uniref:hypothetical protein n=1 Tax=Xylella fastidiosa TaxID=2371 RepID=UPI0035D473FF